MKNQFRKCMGVLLALMVFLCPCVSALAEGTQNAASELPAGETLVDQEATVPSEAAGSSEISDPADLSETPTIPELSDPQEGTPELSAPQEEIPETLVNQGSADTEKLQEEAEDNEDFLEEIPETRDVQENIADPEDLPEENTDTAESQEQNTNPVESQEKDTDPVDLLEEEEPLGATKSADIAAEPSAVSELSNQWSSPEEYFEQTPCPRAEDGQHHRGTRTVEASCTTEGAVYEYCEICHIQWRTGTIPKKAHEYSEEPEYQKSETCTEPWKKIYKCKNCGNTYSISVPAKEHTWKSGNPDGWTTVVGSEPSCGRAGKMIRECSVCGYTETKEVPATGAHVPDEGSSDCTRNVCTVCGTYLGSTGKEHSIVWQSIGSLDKNGMHLGTCSVCGKIVRGDHVYSDDGDCTTPVYCSVCGQLLEAGSGGHNLYPLFEGDKPYYNYVDNGDGTHTGERQCSNAGCTKGTGVITEPHNYDAGVIIAEPAFGTEGKEIFTCLTCGSQKIQTLAVLEEADTTGDADPKEAARQRFEDLKCVNSSGHNLIEKTTPATCKSEGVKYLQCEYCRWKVDYERIPKTRHQYGEPEYQESKICTEPWEKVYTCKICGNTYSISIPAKNHTWKSDNPDGWTPVVGSEPSCGRAGKMIRECSVCGFTETKEVPATGEHVSDEGKSDCTRNVCTVCGEDLGPTGKEHDIDWKPIGPLNKNGMHLGTCSVCGKTVRGDHIYEDDGDCTTPVECPVCGQLLKEGYDGHSYYPTVDSDGTIHFAGTDNGDGTHTRHCTYEGCTASLNIKEAHNYGDPVITVKPGIGTTGKQVSTCKVCGHKEEEILDALEDPGTSVTPTEEAEETTSPAPTEEAKETAPSAPTEEAEGTTSPAPTEEAKETAPSAPTEEAEETTSPAPTEKTEETTSPAPTEEAKETAPSAPTEEAEETTPSASAQVPSGQPTPAFVSEPERPAVFDNTQPQTTEENSALIKGTVEVSDGKSGYKLSVEVKLPKGAASTSKLTVEDVTSTDKAIKKVVEEKFTGYLAYDIQMYNGSTSVQPDSTVEISLELPKKWTDVAVYRIVNGKMVKVKAKVKDGRIVFATEQFGIYILVNNDSAISLQEA